MVKDQQEDLQKHRERAFSRIYAEYMNLLEVRLMLVIEGGKQKIEKKLEEYIRTRKIRMERRNYERNIIQKCINEPKLFYRHKNGKMKIREGTTKLNIKETIHEDVQDMAKVMNKKLQIRVYCERRESFREEYNKNNPSCL